MAGCAKRGGRHRLQSPTLRTIFLLRYLSSVELRHTIQAATNKSEASNKFVQCVCFGGDGVIAENVRDEAAEVYQYNHLVTNLLTFHTLVTLTKALRSCWSKDTRRTGRL